jgi:hypothetical protein
MNEGSSVLSDDVGKKLGRGPLGTVGTYSVPCPASPWLSGSSSAGVLVPRVCRHPPCIYRSGPRFCRWGVLKAVAVHRVCIGPRQPQCRIASLPLVRVAVFETAGVKHDHLLHRAYSAASSSARSVTAIDRWPPYAVARMDTPHAIPP